MADLHGIIVLLFRRIHPYIRSLGLVLRSIVVLKESKVIFRNTKIAQSRQTYIRNTRLDSLCRKSNLLPRLLVLPEHKIVRKSVVPDSIGILQKCFSVVFVDWATFGCIEFR
jgi:hypothetical protein